MQRFLLALLGVILLFVFGINAVCSFMPKKEASLTQALSELLAEDIEGWNSKEVPLASTPEGEQSVLKTLALDDVVCREFSSGGTNVLVYAAYWKPGSQPYSCVALHNPDSCWVNSGWKIEDRENARAVELAGYKLKAHEWGIYSKSNYKSYVMFWHLLGGEPNKFIKYMLWNGAGLDSLKRHFYFIFNISQVGFDLNRDQLFFRISSNKPFDQLAKQANFQNLLKELEGFGLYASSNDG